jgi:hypothetical protein
MAQKLPHLEMKHPHISFTTSSHNLSAKGVWCLIVLWEFKVYFNNIDIIFSNYSIYQAHADMSKGRLFIPTCSQILKHSNIWAVTFYLIAFLQIHLHFELPFEVEFVQSGLTIVRQKNPRNEDFYCGGSVLLIKTYLADIACGYQVGYWVGYMPKSTPMHT